ncbi:MAG: hypothetical protein JSS66_17185 [Armatimonadetes bacterium]|nr:hypothetical protein [Armatimonadota bacterium]
MFLLTLVCLAGCAAQTGFNVSTAGSAPSTPEKKDVMVPHPVVPEGTAATSKPSQAKEALPKLDTSKPDKTDPAVIGSYAFQLNDEQKKRMKDGIEEIRKQADAGNEDAKKALAMAEAARQVAESLTVTLKADGRYVADLGEGATGGTFKMYKNVVVLRPDNQPDPKEEMPPDVALTFDKGEKTLTADYQGQKMVFARKR